MRELVRAVPLGKGAARRVTESTDGMKHGPPVPGNPGPANNGRGQRERPPMSETKDYGSGAGGLA
jgi:hypothetical protein